eukprot:scaffold16316_cov44-Prasinocladus_malaysianus.AAC.1
MPVRILVASESGPGLASLQRSVTKVGGKLFRSAPTVFTTCDGRELVQRLFMEGPVEMVFLDIKLSGSLNGVEAAAQIRQRFSSLEVPIIGLVPQSSSMGLESVDNKLFNELPEPQRVRIKVLIAEDSMANQMVIKRAVRKVARSLWGVEPDIDTVTDGAQAVNAALSNQFDIVLMDIYMPIMSGILATQDIRK